ncbi:MAG TPA: lytic transglycosylase domain-containing protein [Thermoanaerobaculia bacterium]
MKKAVLIVLTLFAATVVRADGRKFSAADVPKVHMKPGRIVISNDATHISAFRFFGDIREALVSLRSTNILATHAYGSVLFDSGARLNAAAPPYISELITEAAHTNGVDPRLVAAVVHRESAFNPSATSSVGACGLMQLMPATARYLGVSNIFDARQNVFAGTRYLRTLLDTFNGDLDLALAAYNAGPGAVQKYKGVPPYRETRAYVAAIRSTYEASLAR